MYVKSNFLKTTHQLFEKKLFSILWFLRRCLELMLYCTSSSCSSFYTVTKDCRKSLLAGIGVIHKPCGQSRERGVSGKTMFVHMGGGRGKRLVHVDKNVLWLPILCTSIRMPFWCHCFNSYRTWLVFWNKKMLAKIR